MTPASLRGRTVGIDARYLKRQGIGISVYLQQAISDLLDAGASLTLLTDDAAHAAELREAFRPADGVALPGRSGFLWEQRTLRRHLTAAGYDAFIAPANYGLPLRYRGRTRLILIVHDLIPLRLPRLYLPRRPAWAAKYLLSAGISARRADHVVAVSDATAGDVARLLRRPHAEVVYPRIPRPERARPLADPQGLGTRSPGSRPYFVYNGGTDVRKNVPVLLRAFSQLRDETGGTDLVLVGAGFEGFRRLIRELGVEARVHLPGYVDEATKAAIMRGALALVYPSRLEGFGIPVVEALAAGIPVISGTGGALREVGGDAAIYVDPLDTRSLAAAMTAVGDPGVRERAREAGAIQLELLAGRRDAATLAGVLARWLGPSADSEHAAL
jgi:glycosyltransferase involved in cell wall biosynthesis